MTDDDPLGQEPFSFSLRKNGLVQVMYQGKVVMSLNDKAAIRFLGRMEGLNSRAAQLLMAKTTGQFKFGNEKEAKLRGKGQKPK